MIGVVAVDDCFGIGMNNGKIPWRIKEDMAHFKELTTGHTVVMGRKTWESIPKRFRPLPDRDNWILTRDTAYPLPANLPLYVRGIYIRSDPVELMEEAKLNKGKIFIIGGKQIYELYGCGISEWYVTHVDGDHKCEVKLDPEFFERFDSTYVKDIGENAKLMHYTRKAY